MADYDKANRQQVRSYWLQQLRRAKNAAPQTRNMIQQQARKAMQPFTGKAAQSQKFGVGKQLLSATDQLGWSAIKNIPYFGNWYINNFADQGTKDILDKENKIYHNITHQAIPNAADKVMWLPNLIHGGRYNWQNKVQNWADKNSYQLNDQRDQAVVNSGSNLMGTGYSGLADLVLGGTAAKTLKGAYTLANKIPVVNKATTYVANGYNNWKRSRQLAKIGPSARTEAHIQQLARRGGQKTLPTPKQAVANAKRNARQAYIKGGRIGNQVKLDAPVSQFGRRAQLAVRDAGKKIKQLPGQSWRATGQFLGNQASQYTVNVASDQTRNWIANSDMSPQDKAYWMNFMDTAQPWLLYATSKGRQMLKTRTRPNLGPQTPSKFRSVRNWLGGDKVSGVDRAFSMGNGAQAIFRTLLPSKATQRFAPIGQTYDQAVQNTFQQSVARPKDSIYTPEAYNRFISNMNAAKQPVDYNPLNRGVQDLINTAMFKLHPIVGLSTPFVVAGVNAAAPGTIQPLQTQDRYAENNLAHLNNQEQATQAALAVQNNPNISPQEKQQSIQAIGQLKQFQADAFKQDKAALSKPNWQNKARLGWQQLKSSVTGKPMSPQMQSQALRLAHTDPTVKAAVIPIVQNKLEISLNKLNQLAIKASQQTDPQKRKAIYKQLSLQQSQVDKLRAYNLLDQKQKQQAISKGLGKWGLTGVQQLQQIQQAFGTDSSFGQALSADLIKYGAPIIKNNILKQAQTVDPQNLWDYSKRLIAINQQFSKGGYEDQQFKNKLTGIMKKKLWERVKENPFQINKMAGLWARLQDMPNFAQFLQNPLMFYGLIGVAGLAGGGLLLGGLSGGSDKQQTQQVQAQPQRFDLYSSNFMR